MSDSSQDPTARKRAFREIALMFGATVVVTVGLTLLQGVVGWVRNYVLVIVAATFLYLPLELLHRTGRDPEAYGIHRGQRWRQLKWALLIALITFPPYLVGFHFWQDAALDRQWAPSEARFDHWPLEMSEPPELLTLRPGEVRLYTVRDDIWLRWRLPRGQRFAADIESDEPPEVLRHHGASVEPGPTGVTVSGRDQGRVVFKAPGQTLSVKIKAGGDHLPPDRLRLGTGLSPADEMPYTAERSWWWLINLILVQLLLVALPEEVFYRGYLQTSLDRLIGQDRKVLGVQVNVASVFLTSALFAVGHYLTIPHPARLAVFFPSVLFGWMRRASGGIGASVLYHAACNLLVEISGHFYG